MGRHRGICHAGNWQECLALIPGECSALMPGESLALMLGRSMKYDPDRHHRRSIRLEGYDYTQTCAYFVTICTRDRECLFDDPVLRRVAETCWLDVPRHFPKVVLDEWVLMPNHFHGILVLGEAFPNAISFTPPATFIGRNWPPDHLHGNASPLQGQRPQLTPRSLGAVIGNFKSVSARSINAVRKTPGAPVWQRNYYEHIIRSDADLNCIREYVVDNPSNWQSDENNPTNCRREGRN